MPEGKPNVQFVINALKRHVDLATADVVIDLEQTPPSAFFRIRVPQAREYDIARFILLFGITGAEWENIDHLGWNWREVKFPVHLDLGMSSFR